MISGVKRAKAVRIAPARITTFLPFCSPLAGVFYSTAKLQQPCGPNLGALRVHTTARTHESQTIQDRTALLGVFCAANCLITLPRRPYPVLRQRPQPAPALLSRHST
jgi:hypothetical protein